MTDSAMAAILARTYFHRVSAWRAVSETEETVLYTDLPCALSRRAINTAPTPPDMDAILPESAYRLTLYTRPEQPFRLHDRVEVTDETGRVYHGRTSDSFRYTTHCVTVVEVYEVREGVCEDGEKNSRETCPTANNGEGVTA